MPNHYQTESPLPSPHRYLMSNCGRPWNYVFSDICRKVGKHGLRKFAHLIYLPVSTCTWRGVSGKIYECSKYGENEIGHSWRRSEFYVEPETGILRRAPQGRKRITPKPVEAVQLSNTTECVKINSIWYYREIVDTEHRRFVSIGVAGRPIYDYFKVRTYAAKKQLNKKELRELAKLL